MISARGVALHAPAGPGGRPAPLLDGIDLDIRKSEYVVLVGANGAGKSLLLQVLAGLRSPSEGEITFVSTNVSVGIVFQSPDDQIVGSTVERDVAFGLENRGLPSPEIRRRVDDALEESGLAPLAGRPPHLLSEGEKQRLALASALVLEPDLLLLDEPTSRLDPPGRRAFQDRAARAHARGAAVVHVTHRSEEILPAGRVVGLDAGRVVFDGTPAELLRSPVSDRLGILWSGLHRLRRELSRRGVELPDPSGPGWNDADTLVAGLAS